MKGRCLPDGACILFGDEFLQQFTQRIAFTRRQELQGIRNALDRKGDELAREHFPLGCEAQEQEPTIVTIFLLAKEAARFQTQHYVTDIGRLHGDETSEEILRQPITFEHARQNDGLGGREIEPAEARGEFPIVSLMGDTKKKPYLIVDVETSGCFGVKLLSL